MGRDATPYSCQRLEARLLLANLHITDAFLCNANGTALTLAPGAQLETSLCAVAYAGLERVSGVSADGEVT